MNDKLRFGEILARAGVLDREALDQALKAIGDDAVDLGEVLVSRGVIDEKLMLKTISKALNLPSISLEKATPDTRAIELVPLEMCTLHCLIPIEVERGRAGEHLHLAMANPSDVKAIKKVTRKTRLRIRPMVASAREIRASIQRHYHTASRPAVEAGLPTSPGTMPAGPPASLKSSGAMPAIAPEIARSLGLSGTPTPPPQLGALAPLAPNSKLTGEHPDEPVFDFGVTDLSQYDTGSGPAVGSAAFPSMAPGLTGAASPPLKAPLPMMHTPAPVSSPQKGGLGADLKDALSASASLSLAGDEMRRGTAGRDSVGVYVKVSRRRTGPRVQVSLPEPPPAGKPSRAGTPSVPLPPVPPSLAGAGAAAGIARSRSATADPFKGRSPDSIGLPPVVASKPRERRTGSISSPRAAARARLSDKLTKPKSGALEHLPTPPGLRDPPPTAQRARLSGPLPDPLLDDIRASGPRAVQPGGKLDADSTMERYLERYDRSGQELDAKAFFADMERMLGDSNSLTSRLLVALISQLGQSGLVDVQALLVEARGR